MSILILTFKRNKIHVNGSMHLGDDGYDAFNECDMRLIDVHNSVGALFQGDA